MSGFERRDGRLLGEGQSLEDLARRHGTPLYVYSRGLLEQAFRDYDQAFAPLPHRVCYALKANANGTLLRVLAGLGAGADIVSGMELRAALRAGFPKERITFSGVGKTGAELQLGLEAGIAEFNCESEGEIEALSRLAVAGGRRAPIALRVNPDIDAQSHPYISTGLRESKFGIDLAAAEEVLERARRLAGIDVVGVQCHIGSQIRELEPLEQAARELAGLARRLQGRGFALRHVDVGGGLGVDYDGHGAPSPAELAARVVPAVRDLGLPLIIEPGRSLVARAGLLLTRVLYVKLNRSKRFVIVDAGMNDLLRPALYEAHHRIEPVLPPRAERWRADVVGPVCESGDFLALDRELPALEPGDLLAVRDAGAYGWSMSSTYNLRPRAAEVLLEDGSARLIRRRETFEDLVRTEQG